MYIFFLKKIPTAFSPLRAPLCPHKKKKSKQKYNLNAEIRWEIQ